MNRKVIAVVGLAGSGKTEAVRFLENHGMKKVRFGELTDQLLKDNNLDASEENEKRMREYLREKEGMHAYAKLNLHHINRELEASHVAVDGMYSWEEYMFLKEHFGDNLVVLALYAPTPVRHLRLNTRPQRRLNKEDALARDKAEIENLNKAGPITIADHMIVNVNTLDDLRKNVDEFVKNHV